MVGRARLPLFWPGGLLLLSHVFVKDLKERSNRFANVKTVLLYRPTVVPLNLGSAFEPLRLLLHICPGHPQGQSAHWGIAVHADWKSRLALTDVYMLGEI